MELTYVQLDHAAIWERLKQVDQEELQEIQDVVHSTEIPKNSGFFPAELSFDSNIPLPYLLRDDDIADELDWNSIVEGILYIGLYEPKHEHIIYYRDFLLALEPELPHILQDRLRDQYAQKQWLYAHDTIQILLFLFPDCNWTLLELCYFYEQKAEEALCEQRFSDCAEAWDLAAVAYQQLLEREDIDARCYLQLGYYYLQCWDYPAAYRAFVSYRELVPLSEQPLRSEMYDWLEKMNFCEILEQNNDQAKAWKMHWEQVFIGLRHALKSEKATSGLSSAAPGNELNFVSVGSKNRWLVPLVDLEALLSVQPDCGFLWYLRGFCMLQGYDVATLSSLSETGEASQAFEKAQALGWSGAFPWQLSYYLGLSYYLEGAYNEAEKYLLGILRHNTEHCASLYWLEKIYEDLEDLRSVQYRAVLNDLAPNFPDLIQSFL